MTWAKLSDDWADRPAILAVSRSARLLHVEALLWSNAQNQGGVIPLRALRRITDAEDPEADAAELVESGAWETTDSGWQLVDSADEQPSVEEIDRRREQNRERQERLRRHRAGDHDLCTDYCRAKGVTRDVTRDVTGDQRVNNGTPTRPVPSRPGPTPREGRGRRTGGAAAPSAGATGATRSQKEKGSSALDHIPLVSDEDRAARQGERTPPPGKRSDETMRDYLGRLAADSPFYLVEKGGTA